MRVKILWLIFPLVFLNIEPNNNGYLEGRVSSVLDADTLIFINNRNNKPTKIRFASIDAPEKNQKTFEKKPIGMLAKRYLEKLLMGKRIRVYIMGKGYYGRFIGYIEFDGQDVGALLIKKGWVLTSFFYNYDTMKRKLKYKSLESIAIMRRSGIWSEGSFYRPDVYRKLARNKSLQAHIK